MTNSLQYIPEIRRFPPHWTALVQSCRESSTNEAYDLSTSWIENTDKYPLGGPSNEEVSSVLQSDTPVVAPTSVPEILQGRDPSGSEEAVTESMTSKEGGVHVTNEDVTGNNPVEEGTITSAFEEDRFIMAGIPNLDSTSLRISSRTPKPSEVVVENRRQEEESK